ncbi:MAG: CBS domain-containing protein [Bradymonadaceae bacterium]
MSVGRICSREVMLTFADETARAATERMYAENVGTLVVAEPDTDIPIGLVTDRDVAVRVVAAGKNPDDTPVRAIMSEEPEMVVESTPIEDALSLMSSHGYRRVVVTDEEDRLVGILSLDAVPLTGPRGHSDCRRRRSITRIRFDLEFDQGSASESGDNFQNR